MVTTVEEAIVSVPEVKVIEVVVVETPHVEPEGEAPSVRSVPAKRSASPESNDVGTTNPAWKVIVMVPPADTPLGVPNEIV
jgi:hypothetical protein